MQLLEGRNALSRVAKEHRRLTKKWSRGFKTNHPYPSLVKMVEGRKGPDKAQRSLIVFFSPR